MADRLREAFANEAAFAARALVMRAVERLESVATATGERRFESVIAELRPFVERIKDAASPPEPVEGDEVLFPDRVETIASNDDEGIRLFGGGWVYRSRLAPAGPNRWQFMQGRS